MLFSEPKIPQFTLIDAGCPTIPRFQCSSASRKFLNLEQVAVGALRQIGGFSALQRAENSSIWCTQRPAYLLPGFSALQRAENSSILDDKPVIPQHCAVSVLFSEPKIPQFVDAPRRGLPAARFQCSSASRKFLNSSSVTTFPRVQRSFSALQRAENSSIEATEATLPRPRGFQCSSASRKFLNSSAGRRTIPTARVSVLFSEPKIPQLR